MWYEIAMNVDDSLAAARTGGGIVVPGELYPEAHELAERGWLKRKFVNGELCWFWTPEAEAAMATNALVQDAQDRQN